MFGECARIWRVFVVVGECKSIYYIIKIKKAICANFFLLNCHAISASKFFITSIYLNQTVEMIVSKDLVKKISMCRIKIH